MRKLNDLEVLCVSGTGVFETAGSTIGGAIGGAAGSQSGAVVGAEIGLAVCAPLGPEASAGCAAVGYFYGRDHGTIAGATAGAVLGGEIGAAIDDLIAEYGDDILNTLGGFYDELVDGASWISDWIRSLLMDVGNGNGGGFQVPQTVDG
ncbi:hypothetical protein [Sphingorhabdus contaminans]|uniref:Uncharacterized protein n=1 Tax=Sphingorhabdus contaminans TaxID=1343899 RepID=A0A553WJW0_9SPHN|nr:hypothetical protein [Sphingorhabdus contaminans]TSB04946.1 hypothetical protein FOM92_06025 [Sphingorhabdus contaminans]